MIEYSKRVLLETDGTEDSAKRPTRRLPLPPRLGPSCTWTTSGTARRYAEREARKLLERQVEEIRAADGIIEVHLKMGQPAHEVIALSEEPGAVLLVVGGGRPRPQCSLLGPRRARGRAAAGC